MDTELHSVPLLVTIINFTFDSKCEIYFEYMKIYFSVVLLQHFVLLRFKRKRKKKSYSSCNQNTLLHLQDSRKRKKHHFHFALYCIAEQLFNLVPKDRN